MAKTFHLTVATVGENLFDGEALSVTLPGADGVFQILADHEALVSQLVAGNIRIIDAQGKEQTVTAEKGGIVEVSSHQATILL
jgi:F-type H+-transporting ATPase subunit epsilon